jgi:AcrR family transcriptional regulator
MKAKPRTRRKEARPQEIVRAALHLFASRGYAATRLDDVAAQAGVSKGTLYLYFANKEALFRAVVTEAVVPNLDAAEQMIAANQGSSADMLRRFVQIFGQVLQTEVAGVAKLIIAEAQNFPEIARFYADTVVKRGMRLIAGVLERGIERGEFRKFDPTTTLPLVIGPFLLVALWPRSLGPHMDIQFDPQAVLTQHVEMLLRGLAPEAAS